MQQVVSQSEVFSKTFNPQSYRHVRLQWRKEWRDCSFRVTDYSKHKCFKNGNYCKKQAFGHLCCWAPLNTNKLTDGFIYFFDAEYTQD